MKRTEIRRELKKLEKRGRLTPQEVVDKASNPKDPLHGYFDWDDTVAGHKWRLNQARTLIRSVSIVTKTTTTEIESVRYVRDPVAPGQGYVSVPALRNEKENARAALEIEFIRAIANLRRAQKISEALDAVDIVTLAISQVEQAKELLSHLHTPEALN